MTMILFIISYIVFLTLIQRAVAPKLKVKQLHRDALVPTSANPGDAGLDLVATNIEWDHENKTITYGTGIAVEIPFGHVGLLFPRSSVYKTGLTLCNSVGVIDSGYRGEIKAKFYNPNNQTGYDLGDKIVQLVVVPFTTLPIKLVDELSSSERGTGGWGSSGK